MFGQMDGALVLDKPAGMTSAACVGMVRRKLEQRKIGHAGTLDPMATGVLILLLGQATKIAGLLLEGGEKIYSGIIRFGLRTDTWDIQGKVLEEAGAEEIRKVTLEAFSAALRELVGEQEQEVPPFSAAKHHGQPLYALARQGRPTPEKTKIIRISRAELEWFRLPLARFRVACSSGTYIRSLAHSLGRQFGCGATLMELTREYSHPFGLDDAVSLKALLDDPALLAGNVRGLREALPGMPVLTLEADLCRRMKHGQPLPAGIPPLRALLEAEQALFLDEQGAPLALGLKKRQGGQSIWSIGRGLWND
ncbi:MAG: tRNA pseudouridine(55) synthase TruB [Desulfovibrionaceae bacterium]|nr:tRNA pseudouridine(55) synthase TruB [Desulfovibrionaceae bacterium]